MTIDKTRLKLLYLFIFISFLSSFGQKIETSIHQESFEKSILTNTDIILSPRISIYCSLEDSIDPYSYKFRTKSVKDRSETKSSFSLNPWDNNNGWRGSVSYFNHFESELSFLLTSWPDRELGLGGLLYPFQYIGLGLEYLTYDSKQILGMKLSYEVTCFCFALQIGTDALYSNNVMQYRITPKIGLSLLGALTLYYGYNYNLINQSKIAPPQNIITLQCNLITSLLRKNKL